MLNRIFKQALTSSLFLLFLKCDRTLSFVFHTFYLPHVNDSEIGLFTYVLRNALSTHALSRWTPSSFNTKWSSNDLMLSWLLGFDRSFEKQSNSPERLLNSLTIFVRTKRKITYCILNLVHTIISTVSPFHHTNPSRNRTGAFKKRSSNPGEFENTGSAFRVDWWHYDNHVIPVT